MRSRTCKALALGLVSAALAVGSAQAVPDEGGGAAQSIPAPQVRVEVFDWSDAGIGVGIGAAAGLAAVGTALAVRRQRIAPHDAAGPAAR